MSKLDFRSTFREVGILRDRADDLLHRLIEQEMWEVASHKSIGTVLKCMGQVTVYDRHGNSFDPNGMFAERPPKFTHRLYLLAERDIEYYSLTGRPLKIFRDAQGQLQSTRDW